MSKSAWRALLPPAGFLLLALLILGPLLRPGYLLRYDEIFSPFLEMPPVDWHTGAGVSGARPLVWLLKGLSIVVPVDVLEKLLWLGILAGAGYLVYRLVPVKSLTARVIAGVFYMVNPFVYDRFMAGHWLFMLGYALTPLALVAFGRLLQQPSWRAWGWALAVWAGLAAISPHHLITLGVLFAGMAMVLVRNRAALVYAAVLPLGVVAVSLWWLLPLHAAPDGTSSFTLSQLYAFATRPDPLYGLLPQMLALQGYWHAGWIQPLAAFGAWWPALWLVVLLPVGLGLARLRRPLVPAARVLLGLTLAATAALFIAAGPSSGTFLVNTWLFEHFPGFAGLREPQKLLALLVMVYAYGAAIGIDALGRHPRRAYALAATSLLMLGLVCWPLWWGAHGQFASVDYPASWYQFRSQLEREGGSGRVLVLPWQPYLEGTFARPLVANPATAFFGPQLIQNSSLNLPGVTSNAPDPYPQIPPLLASTEASVWIKTLSKLDVRYIMIQRSRDSFDYQFLVRDPTVRVLIHDPYLVILDLTPPQ